MSYRRKRRPANRSSRPFTMERLEPRVMLTTLVGGDIFEFTYAPNENIRISLNGNIEADFIGATVDGNQLLLTDLPGHFYQSATGKAGTNYLGGEGGANGAIPVSLNEGAGAPMYYDGFQNRGTALNFQAVASNSAGQTWGLNVTTAAGTENPTSGQVWLVNVDNSTGQALSFTDITSLFTNPGAAMGVTAAVFDPDNPNELYFSTVNAVVTTSGTTTTMLPTPSLYKLDVTNPTGTFTEIPGTFNVTDTNSAGYISALAFDPHLDVNNQHILYGFRTVGAYPDGGVNQDGDQTGSSGDTSGRLFKVDTTNTDASSSGVPVSLSVAGEAEPVALNNITGLAFIPGMDGSVDDGPASEIFGIEQNGADSRLVRINVDNGRAIDWGGVLDTSRTLTIGDAEDIMRGQDLQDLTWNPQLVDPFTGLQGALLAPDATTDDLMFIDYRQRPAAATLYRINVIHSDANAYISIMHVKGPEDSPPITPWPDREMYPFEGAPEGIRIVNLQTGTDAEVLNFDSDIGNVFIGAQTGGDDPVNLRPLDNGRLGAQIGSTLPTESGQTLLPGLNVGTTLLHFASDQTDLTDRLLGANLNVIHGVAAGPNDHLAIIDSDFVDAGGTRVNVDELALVNPYNGKAMWGGGVYRTDTYAQISGVKAMAYGDLNGDGTQELYAIYQIDGNLVLGTINEDPFSTITVGTTQLPTFGGFTAMATLDGSISDVQSIAFTPDGQSLYLVTQNSTLVKIDPGTGAVLQTIGIVQDASSGQTLRIKSMDFDASGVLYGQDDTNQRLVDIDVTTAKAAGNSATPRGSLPQSVGGIAFDPGTNFLGVARDHFVAIDNAWGSTPQQASRPSFGSAMMILNGTDADAMASMDLGKFLVGGVLTGEVNVSGSLGTFYAGSLLTGNVHGITPGAPTTPNFTVGGDLGQLVVRGSVGTVGTQPIGTAYDTGFNLQVGGVLSGMHVGDTLSGTVNAQLNLADSTLSLPQQEVEGNRSIEGFADSTDASFMLGELNNIFFENNDFDHPQYLAGSNSDLSGAFNITVQGSIDNAQTTDFADYYAVALMGGQDVTVQLSSAVSTTPGTIQPVTGLQVGVFDPDGRLIATDYNNTSPGTVNGSEIQFHADRPGVYRIAVGTYGDVNFNGGQASDGNGSAPSNRATSLVGDYILQIRNAGPMAIGGIWAEQNIINPQSLIKGDAISPYHADGSDFRANQGDLGAIVAGGTYYSQTTRSIQVDAGNLRAVVAGNIGNGSDSAIPSTTTSGLSVYAGPGSDPYLWVPVGSVGLLRTTGDLMSINTGMVHSNGVRPIVGFDDYAIGGFFQEIDAGNILSSNFLADMGFGVIRATTMAGGSLTANVDGIGWDGIIDLIDATTLNGTPIYTGPGGNVRYIRSDSVTRDSQFAGGLPEEQTNYNPGEVAKIVDDSGATVQIIPQITGLNQFYDPNNPFSSGMYTGTAVTNLVTYPIRGSGGAVIVSFDVDGTFNIKGQGTGQGATAEIGTINVTGGSGTVVGIGPLGNPVFVGTVDANGNPIPTQPTPIDPNNPVITNPGLDISINGSAQVDVLGINAGSLPVDNLISNGELPSVVAGTIGTLSGVRLGVGLNHWGMTIDPRQLLGDSVIDPSTGQPGSSGSTAALGNLYPFNQQHTGIQSGNIINASAREALGNFMVIGSIGSLTANADGIDNPSVFEGIVGPVVTMGSVMSNFPLALNPNGSASVTRPGFVYGAGSINQVQIGEGIRSAGSGDTSMGGLYAENHIGEIRNQGAGSDIRGAVVAGNNLGSIKLTNGSLIGADILQIIPFGSTATGGAPDFSTARQGPYGTTSTVLPGTTVNKIWTTIDNISLPGNGGIIGSRIIGANIGDINAPGFGIFGTAIGTTTSGTIGDITAGGYGLRAVNVYGGSSAGRILATGNGSQAASTSFEASVRQSDVGVRFDSLSGLSISPMNDINTYLGTSSHIPVVPGTTETGVIQNLSVGGSRRLASVKSWQIRGATLNVADNIGRIDTVSTMNNLFVTTGTLGQFNPGSDVFNLQMTVAGRIKNIRIHGSLTGNSLIYAVGPNGQIDNVKIDNDLAGYIAATQSIGSVYVGRHATGGINIAGNARTGGSLGSLYIGGVLSTGAFQINGDVGTVTTAGDLGGPGDTLEVLGSINKLQVRGNLSANVHVGNNAKTIDVWGSILDGVTVAVDNTLNALLVGGDTQAGATIRARVLDRIRVKGANLATYQIG